MKKEVIEFLDKFIGKDVVVNARDTLGRTALMWASWNGYTGIVKLLIEAGADVNDKDNYKRTTLMYASRMGYIEIVKLLIEAGADVNAESDDWCTALDFAKEGWHKEIQKLLIRTGMKKELRDFMDEHIGEWAGVNDRDNGILDWTALMHASSQGNVEIVKLLIEAGADVNEHCYEWGDTALTMASDRGHKEIEELLINAGAEE